MKPSEVSEMARGLGRLFECTGNCSKCWGEYICDQVNKSEEKGGDKNGEHKNGND